MVSKMKIVMMSFLMKKSDPNKSDENNSERKRNKNDCEND